MRNGWNLSLLLIGWGASWYWAVNFGGRSAWLCFYAIGIVFLYLGAMLWGMTRTVRMQWGSEQSRGFSGEQAVLEGRLHFGRGWIPSGWLLLELVWKPSVGEERLVVREIIRPSWSGTAGWTLRLPALPRGMYRLEGARVTAGDVFGLLRFTRRAAAADHRLLILPQPMVFRTQRAEGAGEDRPRQGMPLAPQRQDVSPFPYGTRPYVPGDPLNRIHWRATARTGDLRAKETELPDIDRLLICLDAAKSRTNEAAFETAVQAAAGGAQRALQQGLSVRLAANDRLGRSQEARGRERFPQLLELLAQLACDGELPAAVHVQREALHMGPGAGIAVITAQPEEALLRLLGRLAPRAAHLVCVVCGEGMAAETLRAWRRQAEAAGLVFTAVNAAGEVITTAEGGESHGQIDSSAAGA